MIGEENKALEEFQSGNEAVFSDICEQYNPLMLAMVSRIILSSFPGEGSSEHDVYMQEATMALYKAAKSYDLKQSDVTFGLYAKICIKNKLLSLKRRLVSQQRKKNASATKQAKSKEKGNNIYKRKSELAPGQLTEVIEHSLSDFEKKVFDLYLQDFSYGEIAENLGVSPKTVDNAVYRIRRKLKKHI